MRGLACIFWANLTPFSLQRGRRRSATGRGHAVAAPMLRHRAEPFAGHAQSRNQCHGRSSWIRTAQETAAEDMAFDRCVHICAPVCTHTHGMFAASAVECDRAVSYVRAYTHIQVYYSCRIICTLNLEFLVRVYVDLQLATSRIICSCRHIR